VDWKVEWGQTSGYDGKVERQAIKTDKQKFWLETHSFTPSRFNGGNGFHAKNLIFSKFLHTIAVEGGHNYMVNGVTNRHSHILFSCL
jgi:hypothetical protein